MIIIAVLTRKHHNMRVRVLVFSATFRNISLISWRSVLLVEETRVPGENHSHWQTLSHNCWIDYISPCVWKSNDKIQCSSSYNYCDVFSSAVAEPGRVESMAWDTIFTENGIHMCLSPLTLWVQILHMVRCSRFNNYVIKFVSDCGFLRVLWFPQPIKLTAMI
jgi:hypothetical protein